MDLSGEVEGDSAAAVVNRVEVEAESAATVVNRGDSFSPRAGLSIHYPWSRGVDVKGNNFVQKMIPGNKVGLIIGKGGEQIKQLSLQSKARIVILQASYKKLRILNYLYSMVIFG